MSWSCPTKVPATLPVSIMAANIPVFSAPGHSASAARPICVFEGLRHAARYSGSTMWKNASEGTARPRLGVRIEAVEQPRGPPRAAAENLQLPVRQLPGRVERIQASGIRGHDTADLLPAEVLLGIVVAQHHAERHPARSHRIEQAAPHAFGRGPRHHIAREDDQIGTFRRQNAVQAGKGLFGLGTPPGFGGVEVHIRELRYLESLVAAEAQHRLLRPDGGRTPDEEGAGRENPLVHLLKIHWFNFTLPLFSTRTVRLRPSPHVTTNSNGTLVETVTAGVSSADLRARTLRSTTPSGPNG